ncbi:SfnB family sulfur acquisition oxidoreductase [Gemmobacter aquaticus]|uniref:SfnB family sulfur acquisition oxidoreductase n=1 Tax=Gemmobacter aquaticus TaxID=490185 RepID=A0A918DE45_9RHOB|nr:SfnB family sulfur acquisition oxidoreductase [Gemmobacter aquaticus]GGO39130.1 SfnB family sulfur acquisition oxidoreductase [Gemmobacter aquaticus]
MTNPASPPPEAHIIRTDAEALEVARALAESFAPGAVDRDRERILPWAELDAFSASGLWGITVPRAHGGAGVSMVTLARVTAIIAAADGSLSQIPQNHFYALEVLRSGAREDQQRFFFQKALRGLRFGNALAEISHRDFKRRTRLVRTPGGLLLQGQKFYCTGAIYAHWIPTLAVDDEDVQQLVFIPRRAPGVSITDDWDGFGQRVTGSGSVAFDQVQVQPEWVVPFQTSFERPTPIGPVAQLIHAAIDLGIGQSAFTATLPFIRDRARPWIDARVATAAEDPLTLAGLGEVALRLSAAEALLHRAGAAVDAAITEPTENTVAGASVAVAEAKVLTTRAGLLAASKLFEFTGTSATFADDNLDLYWRNVRTHTLHDPVRWKYHAIGNFALNGVNPPRHGAI